LTSCNSQRRALVEAGLDPAEVYLTNAVKHFKWQPHGKRRIHERPNREETLVSSPPTISADRAQAGPQLRPLVRRLHNP